MSIITLDLSPVLDKRLEIELPPDLQSASILHKHVYPQIITALTDASELEVSVTPYPNNDIIVEGLPHRTLVSYSSYYSFKSECNAQVIEAMVYAILKSREYMVFHNVFDIKNWRRSKDPFQAARIFMNRLTMDIYTETMNASNAFYNACIKKEAAS